MKARMIFSISLAVLGLTLLGTTTTVAVDNYNGTLDPRAPVAYEWIPNPTQVTGKEYADTPNKDSSNVADPLRVLAFDANLGLANGTDFSGTGLAEGQIDGLAYHLDHLYDGGVNNKAAVVVSVTGDSPSYVAWTESVAGAGAGWATRWQVNTNGVNDLADLQLWGTDWPALHSDRFSTVGDAGGTAVWAYNASLNTSTVFVTDADIANAIGRPDLAGVIDLDALMSQDNGDGTFGAGDSMMFSIRPVDVFDGGEVWVWNFGSPAAFLNHGGHLWNTAFDVKSTFGVANENVDALEVVGFAPEPSTVTLLLFGAGLVWRRSRKQRR